MSGFFGTTSSWPASMSSSSSSFSFSSCPNPVSSASASSTPFGFGCGIPATAQTIRTNKSVPTPVNTGTEDDLKKRISFLSEFFVAFKEQIHTDIQLKPKDGPCIPAHRALLAARSEIFKNMLGSDSCKDAPSDTDIITLSELNTEELESLLEFLYTGNLPLDKLEKHVYSLYVAADKYEVPYLQESCERYMVNYLNRSNAIDILEISETHSNKKLKEASLNFILRNMKTIVSSQKYENFASNNPHLCVQVTRAFVDAKTI